MASEWTALKDNLQITPFWCSHTCLVSTTTVIASQFSRILRAQLALKWMSCRTKRTPLMWTTSLQRRRRRRLWGCTAMTRRRWEAVEDLLKERCEEGHELHFGTLEHIYTGLVGYLLNIEARTHACRLLISHKRKARS